MKNMKNNLFELSILKIKNMIDLELRLWDNIQSLITTEGE